MILFIKKIERIDKENRYFALFEKFSALTCRSAKNNTIKISHLHSSKNL